MSLTLSRARNVVVALAAGGLLATFTAVGPGASAAAPDRDTAPHWFGVRPTDNGQYTTNAVSGEAKGGGKPRGSSSNGIFYHGGSVMTANTTNAYYIWYGDWSNDSVASTILSDFARNVGGSPYFNINTTYYDGNNVTVKNSVTYAGSAVDSGSQGTSNLSDGDIWTIVSTAISSGALPADTNGVYFVLTASNVSKSGFGTQYCGWHTHAGLSGADIKYSFVGNPYPDYLSSCAAQSTGPNGSGGADAMASVIAHELEEAVTDPDLNAWYDRRGYENADKCAWTFGTTYTTSNGAKANMKLGSRDYLIQRNWVNASGGYCALSY